MRDADLTARPGAEADPRPRRTRRLLVPALVLGYVVLSGSILALLLGQLRGEAIESGELLVQSFAQLVEEQTTGTLRVTQQMLETVALRVEASDPTVAGGDPAIAARLSALTAGQPFVPSMWVMDARGVVAYDVGGSIGMDLSDREYFQVQQAEPDAGMRVSVPIESRLDGKWLMPVTLALRDPAGAFAGVVVAALDPTEFDRAWRVDHAGAARSIALLRSDGTLLMRSPFVSAAMGRSFTDTPILEEFLPETRSGTLQATSAVDGVPRLIAFRVMAGFPELVVIVSEAIDQVLAPWRRSVLIVIVAWLAASAALAVLVVLLMRELRRRGESEAGLVRANVSLRAEVADRAGAEADAVEARARLLEAIRAFPGGFRLYDCDERLVLTNDVAPMTDVVGLPKARPGETFTETVRRVAERTLPDPVRREAWVRERLAQFRSGDSQAEIQITGGRWFHVFDRRVSDGGTISLHLDITARKAMEEQLRQSLKMEAIGQLTGGIAHDFNNMLTVIMGNAELLLELVGDDPGERGATETILRAAESSADLTSRLLAFARRTPLQPARVDVNRFVQRMDALLRRSLGEQVDIRMVLAPDLWEVLIDPSQLELAILNLAVNARDAMPDGGKLTVETANAHVDAAYAAANADAEVGDFVVVALSDTGSGMAPETIERAFEPFFTTKEVGKGTGLGLSMVYGFVRQSGGHVSIYSELGRGSTVRLYLPRARDTAEAALDSDGTGEAMPHARGESVLVVEDDELVRHHVAAQLAGIGYRVTSVADGRAALDVLAGEAPIDLLFTDVVMPGGISGRDVADAAERYRPGIRVLFTSGYTRNAIVHGGRLDADARLLSKPYRLRDLAAKVREVLDQA